MENKKNQRDLFYFWAKINKYRSRAAFKLIEMNKKFGFLKKSFFILDLCSAPGSWMQVSREFAPPTASITGIDACKIRTIKGCQTIRGDITSSGCLNTFFNNKKFVGKKMDLVLHDGAPRMGISWFRDSFNQNDLALRALKMSIKCLKKNGWFITKIFCSGYFHGFLFSLRNFFKKIIVCKPTASRQKSAETYLICKGFLSPPQFDKFLLDPKYIFGNLEISNIKLQKKKNDFLSKISKKNFIFFSRFLRSKTTLFLKKLNYFFFNDESICVFGTSFFGSFFFCKIWKYEKKLSFNRILIFRIKRWFRFFFLRF